MDAAVLPVGHVDSALPVGTVDGVIWTNVKAVGPGEVVPPPGPEEVALGIEDQDWVDASNEDVDLTLRVHPQPYNIDEGRVEMSAPSLDNS